MEAVVEKKEVVISEFPVQAVVVYADRAEVNLGWVWSEMWSLASHKHYSAIRELEQGLQDQLAPKTACAKF
jgi:hypothetical protein